MAFPSCDPSFLTFIEQLKSADNTIRSQAEEQFKALQDQDAFQLTSQLFGAFSNSEPQTRAYIAIVLKKLLSIMTWNALNEEQKQYIRQLCLQAFQGESDNNARHQVANIIASVSGLEGEWKDLLPCLNAACSNNNPSVQCEGIYILGEMSDYCPDVVTPIAQDIFGLFQNCISSNNTQVQIATTKATLTFIICNSEESVNPFLALLPRCIAIIKTILTVSDYEQDLTAILISLGDICRLCSKGISNYVSSLLEVMISITNMDLSIEIIKQAFEVIISVAENNSGFLRKNSQALTSILSVIFKYLCEIDEDEDWMNQPYGNEEEMENTFDLPYLMAESVLERLCLAVRGAAVYKIITTNINKFVKSSNWNERRAAFSTIWCISDACSKNIEKDLNVWYSFINQGLNDPHPRINFAALYSLTGLCLSLTPKIQKQYGAQILGSLMSLVQRNPCMRVQGHIASALLSFFTCDKLNKTVYKNYIDNIMNFLLSLCSVNQPLLQAEAIQAINSIAMCIKSAFIPYFSTVLAGLKSVIDTGLTDTNLDLHKSAYECMGSILINIHSDEIESQVKDVLLYLCSILFSLSNTDLRIPILLDTISSIYDVLKTDKEAILAQLIPSVLQLANIDIELSATTLVNDIVDNTPKKEGVESLTYEVKNVGTVSVSVNTNNMEMKYYALGAIYKFIEFGDEEIMPYIKGIYDVVFPLIEYKYYAAIRSLSAEIIGCLVYTFITVNNRKNSLDIPITTSMVYSVLQSIVTQYADEAEEEDCEGISNAFCTVLRACLETGTSIDGTYRDVKIHLPQEYNEELVSTFVSYLKDSVTSVSEYYENIDKEDREQEEQLDELEDMISTEKENLEHLIDSLGYVLKIETLNMMTIYHNEILPMCNTFLENKLGLIQFVGICPVDDMFEYAPTEAVATLIPTYLPFMYNNTVTLDPFLRQACLFGLKVCLERHTQYCDSSISNIIDAISNALTSNDCTDELYASCTDNALSALIILVKKYGQTFKPQQHKQMCKAILSYVPAVNDTVESKIIHKNFVNEVLAGPNGIFNTPDLLKEAQNKLPGFLVPNVIDEDNEDEDTRITSLETQQVIINYLKSLPNGYNQLLRNYGPDELRWINKKMN